MLHLNKMYLYPFFIFLLFLSGCNDEVIPATQNSVGSVKVEDTKQDDSNNRENEDKKLQETIFPNGLEEILESTKGTYAGQSYEDNREAIVKELEAFKSLGEEPSEEELHRYYYKLLLMFSEEYERPLENEPFNPIEPPTIYDGKFQLKPNLNVEIVLDTSGSMIEKVDGQSKMELAKNSIEDFAQMLPNEANVGLRVYGHEGTTAFEDKVESCESSELLYEIQPYDKSKLEAALEEFQPAGWTPLAKALQDAKDDLKTFNGEENTNIIFLVSDGIGTCDGDPVKEAKELQESNIDPIVNIIGFNVDEEGEQQLRDIANASDGSFAYVHDKESLNDQFNRLKDISDKWIQWKGAALGHNSEESSERLMEITEAREEWQETNFRERDNIKFALNHLNESGKINDQTLHKLNTINSERFLIPFNLGQDLFSDLFNESQNLTVEEYKEIFGKYEENS
ncbi:vWA domain-containing protein [Aureibacillus halotolerans]|uniref:Ca-activated chloride channel family protein n=1 Tax=Aureibacillus halotolerans TaxID=1508390 RepID=A0A4R6TLS9_9BACI|nr:VWA domain-containing protein [Aureibacillus halotolerans]TDQ31893.1 Ca-activated chloride channel family protein [Aureibacillus halotolerans]